MEELWYAKNIVMFSKQFCGRMTLCESIRLEIDNKALEMKQKDFKPNFGVQFYKLRFLII